MRVTSAILLEIAAMPEQAMAASLRFLAVQLEADERKRDFAAKRQQRYRDAHSDVSVASPERHNNACVTLARVEDKPLPSSRIEISQQVTPCNPPPEPIDVARDATELIEGWDRFWEAYPKRAGSRDKRAALKAFRAARKRASIETIVAGARAYAAHCDDSGKAGTEFIKQARTWLNGNGWEEDYRHARQPSKPTHGSAIRNAFEEQRADLIARFGEPDAINQGP